MHNLLMTLFPACVFTIVLCACSALPASNADQPSKRDECEKIADMTAYSRCMQRANSGYEADQKAKYK